jgi:hypothetical protein
MQPQRKNPNRGIPKWIIVLTRHPLVREEFGAVCSEARDVLAELVAPASMSAVRAYWTKAHVERGFDTDLILALADQVIGKAREYGDHCTEMLDELGAQAVLAPPVETPEELCEWLFEQDRVRFEGTLCNKCHKPITSDDARIGGKTQGRWHSTCSDPLAIEQSDNRPNKKKRHNRRRRAAVAASGENEEQHGRFRLALTIAGHVLRPDARLRVMS